MNRNDEQHEHEHDEHRRSHNTWNEKNSLFLSLVVFVQTRNDHNFICKFDHLNKSLATFCERAVQCGSNEMRFFWDHSELGAMNSSERVGSKRVGSRRVGSKPLFHGWLGGYISCNLTVLVLNGVVRNRFSWLNHKCTVLNGSVLNGLDLDRLV